ncbi:MAG: glutaredoxin family protein [Acidobacteria bacterium]|nr:glutaredoxin family protein [Acidobacteriota bacterium]
MLAKRYLDEWKLEYEEIDIDGNPAAADFVVSANGGRRKVPTFAVDGRVFHCSPFSLERLKSELGR